MENRDGVLIKIDYPLLIFVVLQVLFVVFCVMSFSRFFASDKILDMDKPGVSVLGLEELMLDSEENDVGTMEQTLLDVVSMNTPVVELGNIKAGIREGSVRAHYFDSIDVNYFAAIVDIPELEQSYWIFHEYSDNKQNSSLSSDLRYAVMCLADPAEIIYQDFDCRSEFNTITYNSIAQRYLRMIETEGLLVSVDDNLTQITIIVIDWLADIKQDNYYINKVKDDLRSLGIYPGLFDYAIIHSDDIQDFQYVDMYDV